MGLKLQRNYLMGTGNIVHRYSTSIRRTASFRAIARVLCASQVDHSVQVQAPTLKAESGARLSRSERLHEKAPKIVVAVLRDAKLWVTRSTLSLPRSEAEKAPTSRLEAKRAVSATVKTYVRAVRVNTRNTAEQNCRLNS